MEKKQNNKMWNDHNDYIASLLTWAARLYATAITDEEIAEAKRIATAIFEGEIL